MSTLTPELQALDELTGGAFSAATSGERTARVRAWLEQEPDAEAMQRVYRELSVKDKGAAKPLRERLDEIKRQHDQDKRAGEWAAKAAVLLAAPRLNVADALAWQRDAAKAGAPLSREPLATLKTQLAARAQAIDDLQHRVQVQREAAALLVQRIELLSTKSWQEADVANTVLSADVQRWLSEAAALPGQPEWPSIDLRFAPQLETASTQIKAVWEAFSAALVQTRVAAQDASAPLPPVPVWADELRTARNAAGKEAGSREAGKPTTNKPEQGVAASPVSPAEVQAKAEATARANQARLELVARAEALMLPAEEQKQKGKSEVKVEAGTESKAESGGGAQGQSQAESRNESEPASLPEGEPGSAPMASTAPKTEQKTEPKNKRPTLGGRKMQEALRELREQWKQIDQSGAAPNHALWKRFDEACNAAHKVVEVWLEKMKAETTEHKAQRLALIEELKAWTAAHAAASFSDWKAYSRDLHGFSERWRGLTGHLSEKVYADLLAQWKAAWSAAHAPLSEVQKASVQRRHAMIEEAVQLGAAAAEGKGLRVAAVKELQQRWQAEAQSVSLDRKHEQKLWDAFRKPIDEAFQHKGAVREQAHAAMSALDRAVLDAAKALDAASRSGDAQAIRTAMDALDAAQRVQAAANQAGSAQAQAQAQAQAIPQAHEQNPQAGEQAAPAEDAAAAPPSPSPAPRKPVVAVRGDDRPGAKKVEPAPAAGRGKPRDERRGDRERPQRGERDDWRGPRDASSRDARDPRAPRLGDAAFRAKRDAMEHAQLALKKLAAQAHGEALTKLLDAWSSRDAQAVPSTGELGGRVTPSVRQSWAQAISSPAQSAESAAEALLRIEIAAELPTPAEYLEARRALQLQLLTRRGDPTPAQTWGQDAARVFGAAHEPGAERRLQGALKVLLRR